MVNFLVMYTSNANVICVQALPLYYLPITSLLYKSVLVTTGKIATRKNLHNYEMKEGGRSIAENILPR